MKLLLTQNSIEEVARSKLFKAVSARVVTLISAKVSRRDCTSPVELDGATGIRIRGHSAVLYCTVGLLYLAA